MWCVFFGQQCIWCRRKEKTTINVWGKCFCLAGPWHKQNIIDCNVALVVFSPYARDNDPKVVGLRGNGNVRDKPILRDAIREILLYFDLSHTFRLKNTITSHEHFITKTRPCNILQFFKAIKLIIFRSKIVIFFMFWFCSKHQLGSCNITKTSPCNEHPLTPHFYQVKLGFTGVYIFLISAPKHRLWVLVRTASLRRF